MIPHRVATVGIPIAALPPIVVGLHPTSEKEIVMIGVTDRAVQGLEQILTSNEAPPGSGVKLIPDDRGAVSMVIDHPRDGDSIVAGNERPVLIVDAALIDPLDRAVLDMTPPDGGEPRFHFRERTSEDGSRGMA